MKTIINLIAKRVALGLLTVIVISLLIFAGIEALPGDLARIDTRPKPQPKKTVAAFRKEMKLDLPAHTRYLAWSQGHDAWRSRSVYRHPNSGHRADRLAI